MKTREIKSITTFGEAGVGKTYSQDIFNQLLIGKQVEQMTGLSRRVIRSAAQSGELKALRILGTYGFLQEDVTAFMATYKPKPKRRRRSQFAVTCPYCGTLNPLGSLKCLMGGASLEDGIVIDLRTYKEAISEA